MGHFPRICPNLLTLQSFGIHVGRCGRHKAERAGPYLGRAVRQVVTTNCEESAEAIVPEKKTAGFGEGLNLI